MIEPARSSSVPRAWTPVWLIAAVVVVIRIPLLHLPAWADEAGFLQVGGQWHLGGGASLYGDYWVDRPPFLITVFGLAHALGGLTALRILGSVLVGVSVLAIADFVRTWAGRRSSIWAAVCAGALLSSPYHWAYMVDGELVACALVCVGLAFLARGVNASGRQRLVQCAAAGAAGALACLTKQNFGDVFVFVVVFAALAAWQRSMPWRETAGVVSSCIGGAFVAIAAMSVWTIAHGTSLHGVWYAMYRFRVDAAANAGSGALSSGRLATLGLAGLLSGLVVVALAVVVSAWRPLVRRDPVVGALVALLVFDVFSVLAGTSYWLHYLLQPSIPAAALAGVLVGRAGWLKAVVVLCGILACVGYAVLLTSPPQTAEEVVGAAVGRAAQPGDELVTVGGRANVNLAARLPSPYPYLWALPARTLDPGRHELVRLLGGSRAPAWFVSWVPLRPFGSPESVAGAISNGYRPVARICGRTIYLRDDLERATPTPRARGAATTRSVCTSVAHPPRPLGHAS